MKYFRYFLLLIVFLVLPACIATPVPTTPTGAPVSLNLPTAVPPTRADLRTPTLLSTPSPTLEPTCPEPVEGTRLLIREALGFCLLHPEAFAAVDTEPAQVCLVPEGPAMACHSAQMFINVEGVAGRTLHQIAVQIAAGARGTVQNTPLTLSGEEALMLEPFYGVATSRKVLVVHAGRLYTLEFIVPGDEDGNGDYEQLERFYTLVINSFEFLNKTGVSVAPPATPTTPPIGTPTSIKPGPFAIPTELLPHSLYYLAHGQVVRMERDGKTAAQLTFEELDVTDYDVSPTDGSVAYLTNNQVILIDADGLNRRVLVDGGPREAGSPWVSSPVFSLDGKTLAYGHNGLNLRDLLTGASHLVIEDQFTEPHPDGMRLPIETFAPVRFSPDGSKLLVALGKWESLPWHAVYYPDTGQLVRYTEGNDYVYCCSFHGGPVWSPDSSSFYGVASIHDTCCLFGELWRVDARTGALTRTLRTRTQTAYLPKEIYLAPDGHLYFFFGTYRQDSGFWDASVLNLVRAAPNGETNRIVLRDENFVLMQEALWAPEASFVIVSTAPSKNWNQEAGVLELYYTDGQKPPVWLAPMGYRLKWGP